MEKRGKIKHGVHGGVRRTAGKGPAATYVSWKQRKAVAQDLRLIYHSATAVDADLKLDACAKKWDAVCPMVSQVWRRNWDRITPFFAYPPEIRKVIYTTNAIESLNMSLRKIIKMHGSFPNDEAAFKLLYLALRNASKKWTMPAQDLESAFGAGLARRVEPI